MTLFFPFLPATTRLYANKISAPRRHEKYREFSRRKQESVFERKVRWALGRELKSLTRVKGRFVGSTEQKRWKKSWKLPRFSCVLQLKLFEARQHARRIDFDVYLLPAECWISDERAHKPSSTNYTLAGLIDCCRALQWFIMLPVFSIFPLPLVISWDVVPRGIHRRFQSEFPWLNRAFLASSFATSFGDSNLADLFYLSSVAGHCCMHMTILPLLNLIYSAG